MILHTDNEIVMGIPISIEIGGNELFLFTLHAKYARSVTW